MIDANKLMSKMSNTSGDDSGYRTEKNGDEGFIKTPGIPDQDVSFDTILTRCGFDPDEYEIDGTPAVKRWEAQTPDGQTWMSSYGIKVRKRVAGVDVDDLVAAVHKPTDYGAAPRPALAGAPAVFAVGDLQLGKPDGDGSEGTIERFRDAVDKAVRLYREEPTNSVLIAFLGDLLEGVVSQGGKIAGYSDLTLTEQLRVMRHLAVYAINQFREHCGDIHVATAPGNHGESFRTPFNSKPSDNFDTDVIRAVEEAFELAGVGGITFHYPTDEELSVSVELGDTKILCAHGHMWRKGKAFDWWAGQTFGKRTGWDAQYLLAGHLHHLCIEASSERLFIQVPAMESRSDWWRNKTGETGNPGAVYMIAQPNGQPLNLTVV